MKTITVFFFVFVELFYVVKFYDVKMQKLKQLKSPY